MSADDEKFNALLARSMPVSTAAPRAIDGAWAELQRNPVTVSWRRDALVLAAVNTTFALTLAGLLSWSSVQHRSRAWMLGGSLLWLSVVALGSFWAVKPGRGRALWLLVATAVACGAQVFLGASQNHSASAFWQGLKCSRFEVLLAIVPMVASMLITRRFAVAPLSMALAATAAGAVGLLALHLHCPIGDWRHLGVFHLLPWPFLVLAGVAIRRKLSSTSHAP